MKHFIIESAHYLPFVSMMVGMKETTPMVTRLLEAGIIGVIIMYGVQNTQAEKIDSIKQDISEIKYQNQKINTDMTNVRIDIERLKQFQGIK
jgi:outer membrane murein-binding lipoprotein Lpp